MSRSGSAPAGRAVRLAAAGLTAAALAGCAGAVDAPLAAQPPVRLPVPDVVGTPLDVATAALDAAGFAAAPRDALRHRARPVGRTWVVCTQDPGPVPAPAGTVVELGVVEEGEACPGPAPAPLAAMRTVPTTALPTTGPRAAAAPPPTPTPAPRAATPRRILAPDEAGQP
ncbi:MAG TPA: hypothetical protein VKZ81_21355 [Pseudonocardia sp.]|uniref:hypothetical protein n=1 Tax=Pseudonocardia sp. TaxID=60912 RepID=UPI002B4B1A51|nr:hypothetical protein [Pseudonocardia sp.]HLU58016.1 hypothetical protein [Pseudonocardia sp.]